VPTPRRLPRIVKGFAVLTVGAYIGDVLIRPAFVARSARDAADARGKPLLNLGAGTPHSSVRVMLLGPTLWGDVNLDLASKEGPCGSPDYERPLRRVCQGDAMTLPYGDKEFGAIIASHVLEHLPDWKAALAEWERVADEVFVVVPWWWAPHSWLHPGHTFVFFGTPDEDRVIQIRNGEPVKPAPGSLGAAYRVDPARIAESSEFHGIAVPA
jgi:SAM-dependent methyltransferase